ncbi:hypothetical protein [Winogradskyella sp. 3972H.M.0a.05]|uniref:hypothetical protein n=1 Tax=Winogradskyella sp. 3972H.M.0a.05 TaxID=2950277 RepID=UPI0033986CFD
MQIEDFTYILQNPQNITKTQVDDISKVVSDYPYFQPARALLLKGLKNIESFKYNQELKTTAAYTSDRSILFDYITSEAFNQNEISQQIKQNSEYLKDIVVNELDDISVEKSVAIDHALKQQIKDTEGVLDPDLFEKKPTVIPIEERVDPIINIDIDNITQSAEEALKIGQPLEFNKSETHSFTEWLKITSFKPIVREEEPKKSAPIETKLDTIDKFLSANPKIKPSKETTSKPLVSNQPDSDNDGLMTETLARIYLEQKNYEKALQSYKILSLKYPEKSGFFADQIKAIKELQEKNNI